MMRLGTLASLASLLLAGVTLLNSTSNSNSNSASSAGSTGYKYGKAGDEIRTAKSTVAMAPDMLNPDGFSEEAWNIWSTLPPTTQQDILNRYITAETPTGLFKNLKSTLYSNDIVGFTSDLEELVKMLDEYNSISEYPELTKLYNESLAEIEAENEIMNADLDRLLSERTSSYNTQLQNLSEDYNSMRRSVLDQQYMQNAQLMNAFNSNMDRHRRNAIEAGASAGIRIADNVNQLLSVQNKQSATAMDTANQLSQMMINQRNAEASVRNDYLGYVTQDTANRHSIMNSTRDRASSAADIAYANAYSKYNKEISDFESNYNDNALYDQVKKFNPNPGYNSSSSGSPKYSYK